MDWSNIAPMLVTMTLILTVGAVALLRPLAKRLGDLVQLMIEERRRSLERPHHSLEPLQESVEALNARLALLEERQDFTDALLTSARRAPEQQESLPEASVRS